MGTPPRKTSTSNAIIPPGDNDTRNVGLHPGLKIMKESLGSKKTRRWVHFADQLADKLITFGGVFVIGAVLLMMVFLVYVVIPLFQGGRVEDHASYSLETNLSAIQHLFTDDHNTIAVALNADGGIYAWHLSTGKKLSTSAIDFKDKQVTAFAKAPDGLHIVAGLSSGEVRFGTVSFPTEIVAENELPTNGVSLNDRDCTDGHYVYSRIPGRQIRKIQVAVDLDEELLVSETESPIVAMDYRFLDTGERPVKTVAIVDNNHAAVVLKVTSKLNLYTRKIKTNIAKVVLPVIPKDTSIRYVIVNEGGDSVILGEDTGRLFRYSLNDPSSPVLAETLNITDNKARITCMGYLLGDKSLVVGSSDGSVIIYYLLPQNDSTHPTLDGKTLKAVKVMEPHEVSVTAFEPSKQTRAFVTADANGTIKLRHGTSEKTLLQLNVSKRNTDRQSLALSTRLDGLLSVETDGSSNFWGLSVPHPETSLKTLFGKVWYEGYPEPSYTWQSTGGTDAFEPKLSLVPLIFGTMKATFYSLIFAIPLALFGAVYTSEFLSPQTRGKIKPVMEVMASLPSVVLGFVAALVLAPVVENWITAVLLAFVIMPSCLILGGYLWQLLPPHVALALEGRPKFAAIFLTVGIGLYAAYALGPIFERVLFGGNFKAWLNKDVGNATPFLFLINLPFVAAVLSCLSARFYGQISTNYIKNKRMPYSALLDLLRWSLMALAAVAISYILAFLMNIAGLDPRGSFVGTYVQRNTLIIGFAMGFAVVPIIYTLAEDALNAVPQHLRSASLGCGATPWQTAMWIVIPTAASGIFSATMIGMGRAVGETMIVVMATGNTPIIDLNIFNGLRALSANIAVELPEAPKDGTLYRVLFLTGLVLFVMTFVINTVAEMVRLRFRKKATEL